MKHIPYFDTHCDTISLCRKDGRSLRRNGGHLDLERLRRFRKAVQFFAMYHSMQDTPPKGLFSVTAQQQSIFAAELEKNADIAVPCRTAADIAAAHAEDKIAAILTCEGAELLNCDLNKLDWADEVGIRAINVTWNHPNLLSGTHLHEPTRGLSPLGREFVRQAQARNILIDVSHCSDVAFWDIMKITEKPLLASHSNSRAVCGHTRNVTDDMFLAIKETGGVVGLNFFVHFISDTHNPAMDCFLRHIDHFMELGGEKHIGLGGDLDGCDPLPGGMTGVQDLHLLWDALASRGYSTEVLEDIFFNNHMRLMA